MSGVVEGVVPPGAVTPGRRSVLGLIVRNPLALTGLVVISAIVVAAALAGVLAPHDPFEPDLALRNAPPGTADRLLGADGAGRDIASRLLLAGRLTLLGAFLAVAVATLVGVPSGLAAGYVGGRLDAALSWIADVLLSIPGIVVLLAVIAAVGSSVLTTMTAFGLVLSPHMFRLARSQTIGVRSDLYIDAARVAGLSDARIVARHVLYVVRAPIVIQASYLAGIAVIVQSGLEFLGLGDAEQVTWGAMLGNAFAVIYQAPSAMYWPGGAMALTVASLLLVGNGLRDALEGPRSTSRPRAAGRAPTTAPTRDDAAGEVPAPAASAEPALEITALRVGYPAPDGGTTAVVDGVDLRVGRGEIHGLVGESGSGKTQTAYAVLGLLPPGGRVLGGRMRAAGHDLGTLTPTARRRLLGSTLAYVPQEPMSNLDPAFRIGHQLVEPLRVQGLGRRRAEATALDLLEEVGIPDPRRTFAAYPHQISGGMAQRVLIAGAVSRDPEVLVADEPTTALDVTTQAEVLRLLRRLRRERDLSVLIVTHNLGVVADICDTVSVMRDGRVVESAAVDRLFAEPAHEYTRALLAASLDDASTRPPWRDPDASPTPAEGRTP